MADQVGGLTAGTALDPGAGEGRNALWLAEQGWAVSSIAQILDAHSCDQDDGPMLSTPCEPPTATETARHV